MINGKFWFTRNRAPAQYRQHGGPVAPASPELQYYLQLNKETDFSGLGMDDKPPPYCQRVLTPVIPAKADVGSSVVSDRPWRKRNGGMQ